MTAHATKNSEARFKRAIFTLNPASLQITGFSSPLCKVQTNMIEITCNDRLGKKVRVKCKYPY